MRPTMTDADMEGLVERLLEAYEFGQLDRGEFAVSRETMSRILRARTEAARALQSLLSQREGMASALRGAEEFVRKAKGHFTQGSGLRAEGENVLPVIRTALSSVPPPSRPTVAEITKRMIEYMTRADIEKRNGNDDAMLRWLARADALRWVLGETI